jgi:hypothetical protein
MAAQQLWNMQQNASLHQGETASVAGPKQQQNGTGSSVDGAAAGEGSPDSNGSESAAAAAGQFDEQAAALQLFGPDLLSVLGVPRTRHYVCAVPDASGGLAGLTYCLGPTAAAAADSLADVLSSMKASIASGTGFGRCAVSVHLIDCVVSGLHADCGTLECTAACMCRRQHLRCTCSRSQ